MKVDTFDREPNLNDFKMMYKELNMMYPLCSPGHPTSLAKSSLRIASPQEQYP